VSPNNTMFPGQGGGGGRMRPERQIYRPPATGHWNPEAQEFSPLRSSRSVDLTGMQQAMMAYNRQDSGGYLHRDKMGHNHQDNGPHERALYSGQDKMGYSLQDNIHLRDRSGLTITVRDKHASPRVVQEKMGLRKSRSLAADMSYVPSQGDFSGLGSFSPEIEVTMKKALEDPNRLPGRTLMELVRQIFSRLVEGQKMAEPAARFCISIIEREKKETFLESLLNTCQEWYHERNSLLRCGPDSSHGRWSAFMSFLNEMYGLLKRKQLQLLTKYEGIPPKLVLLSLLGECCMVTLTQQALNSVNEVECLFIVLTQIGRDLEVETPGQMSLLLACLREAFLQLPAVSGQVRKTLLQLIELQAAGWQLPAQAVMYYYPGANIAR